MIKLTEKIGKHVKEKTWE